VPVLAGVAAIAVVAALPSLAARRPGEHRLDGVLAGIGDARRALAHPSWRLLGAAGWLGFDVAVLWTAFAAVGGAPPVAALMLGYSIGYIANALPVPGGVGVLDAGLVGALLLYGASPTDAAAAVLVYHAIAFWIPALGGLIAYTRLRPRLSADPLPRRGHVGGPSSAALQAARADEVHKLATAPVKHPPALDRPRACRLPVSRDDQSAL
jgi:uncharacterized membrane protein YbhN (UPF0104 family)